MRKRIFEVIEVAKEGDKFSNLYDIVMMVVITCSLIPLTFKATNTLFDIVDKVCLVIFIIDYLLRLWTADYKLNRGGVSYLIYPITPMALIDLLCILPSFGSIAAGFRVLKVFRLLRTFRVFRAFKFLRYSKSLDTIINVIKHQKEPLMAVGTLAVGYIVVSALVIFNVEPETFDNFFSALYWATVSLTTIGYGDIYPISNAGHIITMISSFIGIAIVALPSGIMTAGYIEEIRKDRAEELQSEETETEQGKE